MSSFKSNSLSLIRLLAAISVMYIHIIRHLQISIPVWISFPIEFIYGVPVFFSISGFLIWKSIESSKGFKEYSIKRFFRIYPELWVAVLVEILGMGITYPQAVDRKTIIFVITQGSILQFWTPSHLRGYGCGTPNGSLWTIGVMVQSYVVIYFLYKLLHKKAVSTWTVSLIASMSFPIVLQLFKSVIPKIIFKLIGQTFIPYLWLFILGAFISEFFEEAMPVLKKYWYVFLLVSLIVMITGFDINKEYYAMVRCSTLVVGLIGLSYAFPKIDICLDISYALYLYHMTVVNVMIQLGMTGQISFLVLAILISALFACISTVIVGRWSKNMKYRPQKE